ncbi:MAG: hypothetical protein Q8K59_00165 [Nitrosomonas sp.]|nr:hypothetical protein [Nitrosomonas sp.]MDP1949517.1 hypothetical protein [Nitrosomonas sp.]
MVTKRGKQASRKAAARKYGFLEVPLILKTTEDTEISSQIFCGKKSEGTNLVFFFLFNLRYESRVPQ